jgi:hypothetical protein
MTPITQSLPYKISYTTLTASAMFGLNLCCDLPFPQEKLEYKAPIENHYNWENTSGMTSANFDSYTKELVQQMKDLQEFATRIYTNSIDLSPEITDLVSDNFEDLLA